MEKTPLIIIGLGFLAQGLFGLRLVVQLFLAEKAGKIVSPTVYWYISLLASALFLLYGVLRHDLVIIFGQFLSYFIYLRNLQLKKVWQPLHIGFKIVGLLCPFLILGFVNLEQLTVSFGDGVTLIFWIGAIGQLLLNLRYIYQWLYSEKVGASTLPLGFWYISAGASIMVIFYAWHKSDPVLLVAQGMGIVVYLRNLMIGLRHGSAGASE